ncbi:MAG TPA: nitroreductase [Candidatus Monoglobus merdigallinarum]|uniref:Nitroreductase n=1 Tax=Candidatus Monoglobus merdigallinarum TaxID=2838698 RepID=A0A9D1PRQ9_9FIRM|nr:nitroreductase [Candidatus Monoglobus merdigallinarum]
MNETITTLISRRSVRKYKPIPVDESDLKLILKAGTYAATAMGKQSPVIVVVRDIDTIREIEKLNAAVLGDENGRPFYGAQTLAIVFCDTRLSSNCLQDGSLVMGNLMNAAYSLGIDSCWINRAAEVFKSESGKALMKKWGLDDNFIGIGNCILGYRDGELPEAKPRKENYIIWN